MSARALRLDRLLLALLAVVPAGCGGGGGAPPPPPPPSFEVLETSPEQDADGIEPEAVVVGISLSDAASAATALPTAAVVSVGGQPAPMVVTWSVDRTSLAIVVGGLIPPDSQVIVDLQGVRRASDDLALDPGANLPLQFTIAPAEVEIPPSPLDPGRFAAAAAGLPDGRLLVVGGLGGNGVVRGDAQILDDHATVTAVASVLATPRWGHGAARLADGRVLLLGGLTDAAGSVASVSSELYDPATGLFLAGPDLAVARGFPTVLETSEGLIVVVGGVSAYGGAAATATLEAFDAPRSRFAALTTGLPVATAEAAAAPLPGGSFLVAGGVDAGGTVLESAYVFVPDDTTTRTTVLDGLVLPRRGAAAALAPSGQVFVFGGFDGTGVPLASIERFDPVSGVFELLAATLSEARAFAQVVVLGNGALTIVGGLSDSAGTASAALDVFDPSTGALLASHLLARPIVHGLARATADGGLLLAEGATNAALPPSVRTGATILTPAALGSSIAAPRVVTLSPPAGATSVDVDSTLRVTFSKLIDAASLADGLLLTDTEGKVVEGTLALQPDGLTAVFTPSHPLPVLQAIRLEVLTTVTDLLGTPLVDDGARKMTFTTGYDLVVGAADDGSQFGYAVASGDVNGDGIDDMVVSAYVAEPVPGSGVKPGQVYVILGRSDLGPTAGPRMRDLSNAATAADLTISFETDLDQPGIESALQVGDIDGDGYDDIVVGAHNADGPTETNANMGEVFVVFGQPAFLGPTLQLGAAAVAGFDVLRIYGAATSERFGEGMALGDVDDDGYLDMLIGARFASVTGASNVGAVYVVFGGSKSTLGVTGGYGSDRVGSTAATLANMRVLGQDASDNLGWSAACGDLDGDGYADIIAGSTGGDGPTNTASSSGEAVVVFGAARSTLIPSGLFAELRAGPSMALPGFVITGDDASDFLAWSADCSDFDGDGYADIALGALLADGLGNVGNGRGELDVVFGGPRSAFLPGSATWALYDLSNPDHGIRLLRLHGEADGHSFGDCSRFADVDADGVKDLIVGDYQARGPLDAIGANVGELSVLRGTGLFPAGTLEIALRTDGQGLPEGVTLTRLYGKAKVVRFGTTIAVGDFNDDGLSDLMTGANQAKGLGRLFNNGGEAYVFWGRSTWWK